MKQGWATKKINSSKQGCAGQHAGRRRSTTTALTGDGGMVLFEYSPFGVIGSVAPSTNPTETIINNSISMLAAGNSVHFSPHPGAKRSL